MHYHNTTSPDLPLADRMQLLLERWQAAADPRADFLGCYRMMTANMLAAIRSGEFHDPDWVSSLLNHFAGYYFKALDAYDQGLPDIPQVWRYTFESAQKPHSLVLQNLMLGVNAHINYDLIFALEDMLSPYWQQLSADERRARYDDHCRVNHIIQRTIDSVQDTIIEPEIPLMEIADRLFGQLDERVISRMITHWRDEVWEQARLLLETSGADERLRACQQIEDQTLKRAHLIQHIFPGG